ncbi:hypothetical protein [Cryobacterium sp. GrIS_2_6]|uniref:RCC1 domain-containing protein n=1 Tax=Cryobacterium sp. GrIS_2_6 TaxID=3162785 RepID=UPI002E10BBE8
MERPRHHLPNAVSSRVLPHSKTNSHIWCQTRFHVSRSSGHAPSGSGVTAIAAGHFSSMALRSDGTVTAWGMERSGDLTIPAGLSGVISIAMGGFHSLALKADGTVVAWGNNVFGQSAVPVGLTGVVAIAAGFQQSLALKSDGTVIQWGESRPGDTSVPTGLSGVVAIASGDYHSLALKATARWRPGETTPAVKRRFRPDSQE